VECTAKTGKITELEEEANGAEHPEFAKRKKIDEARAREIALKQFPGEVKELEYELEQDGGASYEYDIHTQDGKEMKVEVDAASGNISEANEELWQIGVE
jgi:uncharacterized membrane protein YkoI